MYLQKIRKELVLLLVLLLLVLYLFMNIITLNSLEQKNDSVLSKMMHLQSESEANQRYRFDVKKLEQYDVSINSYKKDQGYDMLLLSGQLNEMIRLINTEFAGNYFQDYYFEIKENAENGYQLLAKIK